MKEWKITFLDDREPLTIKGDTFAKAIEGYLSESYDLRYADLRSAALRYANLTKVYLTNANLAGANLQGADLDYSCLPFNCKSLEIKIDKRIACQLLYHTLRAMQSVDDAEVKAILNDDKVLALTNQFSRVSECGEIVKDQSNE